MKTERPTAVELFNAALECFRRGEIHDAVAWLRAGFYENLYVAPALLGEELAPQPIWHSGAGAEPRAAQEYVSRYGHVWREEGGALSFLREIWNDPVVRQELRRYTNLAKAILQTRDEYHHADLLRERDSFTDLRRIRSTQSEILARLESIDLDRPLARPRFALILLAARDPTSTVEFYRRLFQVEPVRTSRLVGGYAEFELPGVRLGIHGHNALGHGDPYRLGPPPASLGWGAIFVIRVGELERYYSNAVASGIDVLDGDLETKGKRFFLVKDPSGYLLEVTEEEARGV
jgi:predicted enzyme related to lactoylglutathione lyase